MTDRVITLPEDSTERKQIPITTGVLDYFPRALAYVARISKAGNDKHNPNEPLHWAKHKSTDHADCIGRHLLERGLIDSEGVRHSGYLAWRGLALLEMELEAEEDGISVEQLIREYKEDAQDVAAAKRALEEEAFLAPHRRGIRYEGSMSDDDPCPRPLGWGARVRRGEYVPDLTPGPIEFHGPPAEVVVNPALEEITAKEPPVGATPFCGVIERKEL